MFIAAAAVATKRSTLSHHTHQGSEARKHAKKDAKAKWGKKYHTDQKLKCVKLCLSLAKVPTRNTVTAQTTDLSTGKARNWKCCKKMLWAEEWRSMAITQYIKLKFRPVIIFCGDSCRFCCCCFGWLDSMFCFVHFVKLRRCGQLHNLTPCYNKCMLLNVRMFLARTMHREPPKVKYILSALTRF